MTSPYPPHVPVSVADARAADAAAIRLGVPGLVLMEHAGRGLALLAAGLLPPPTQGASPSILVVCGPGNNGGDGYAAARFLASFGLPVRVLRTAGARPLRDDARAEEALASRSVPIEDVPANEVGPARLAGAGVIVDALYGVGVSRDLEGPDLAWVHAMNASNARRLCADVPSGLDADLGAVRPIAVRAHVTAAMGLVKRGCTAGQGPAWCGRIVEVDIGLPREVHAPHLARPGSAREPSPTYS